MPANPTLPVSTPTAAGPARTGGELGWLKPVPAAAGTAMLLAATALAWSLAGDAEGRSLAYALGIGLAFGIVLQRSRFCFFCNLRDLIENGDARGVLAILLALVIGTIGMHLLFMSWIPLPGAGRLPPDAHIGPVSWALVLAAAAFGLGMVLSGSCIGAHWYRLGEGAAIAPFALIGSLGGFMLGFNTWDLLFRTTIATAPIVWLPSLLGYAGSIAAQLLALGLLAIASWHYALRRSPPPSPTPSPSAAVPVGPPTSLAALFSRVFGPGRWPAWVGGLAVGWLAMLVLLRLRPLGVTAALGSGARQWGEPLGLVPERLPGLDSLGGCATLIATVWSRSPNTLLILGLVAGSTATALIAGQFRPRRLRAEDVIRGLAGGLLLGWGAMTALGCTVGTLLSGTMAGALSGWVFFLTLLIVVWAGIRLGWAPRIARP